MAKTKTFLRAVGSISILYIVLSLSMMAPLATLAHAQEGGAAPAAPAAPAEQQATEAKININTATEQDLLQLKRLTPDLAKRIIAYREKKGPFKKTDGIRKVKGIGPKFWQANKDRITVEEGTAEKKEETGAQTPETSKPAQPPQEVTPPPSPEPAPKAEGTAAPAVEGSTVHAAEEKAAAPAAQEAAPLPVGEKTAPPQEAK